MKSKEKFHKKAIHFDLDTSELKKIFQTNNPFVYMKAYTAIGRFLKSKGFEHRQWSGYTSKEPMSDLAVTKIVQKMSTALPWLKQCVKKFDVTNIGDTFDLMFIFDKQKVKTPSKAQDAKQADSPKKPQQQAVLSVKDIKRNAKIISEKARNAPKKEQSRNMDNVL